MKNIKRKLTKNKKLIPVPKFTYAQLKIADLCARELWRDRKYDKSKKIEGDEKLLNTLFTPFDKLYRKRAINYRLTKDKLYEFIKTAELSGVLRAKSLNKQKGIDSIRLDIVRMYRAWIKNGHNRLNSNIPSNSVTKLGQEFFLRTKKRRIGNHIALASRVLFFAVPNMKFFNYSTHIASALGFQTNKPFSIIDAYYQTLNDGLILNWNELTKFDMPLANHHISDDLWLTARNNGWWQRRIYDLALLIHLAKRTPKPFLQSIASQPIRMHP